MLVMMAGHDDVQDECKSFSSGHMRRRRIHTDIGGLRSGGSSGLVDGDEVNLTGKGRTYRIQGIDKETRWDSSVQYDNERTGFDCKRRSYYTQETCNKIREGAWSGRFVHGSSNTGSLRRTCRTQKMHNCIFQSDLI